MVANVQTKPQTPYTGKPIINDFTLMAATKNGTGSQTSNNVLVLSLFKMGIPVNGKNLFPSNIKGLPTWYTIRANKDGYIARPAMAEISVVLNEITAAEDIQKVLEQMDLNFLRFDDIDIKHEMEHVLKIIENYILDFQENIQKQGTKI